MRSASAFASSSVYADQRSAPRVVFHRKGSLIHSNGSNVPIKIVDISTSGVGLFCAEQLKVTQRCTLNIPTFRPELAELIVDGTVAYSILTGMHGFRIGVEFAGLQPKAKSFIERIIAAAP